MARLIFDHSYTADINHLFYKKLKKLGFILSPIPTKHPGKHLCRFIMFKPKKKIPRTYLEFIHIGKGGVPIFSPGVSFRAESKLKSVYEKIDKSIKPHLFHRNYNWQESRHQHLPGWNFLDFKKCGFRGIHTWLTEYEPNPLLKKKPMKIVKHPNGVQNVYGLEIEINKNGKEFFQKLFNKKIRKTMSLPGGQKIFFVESQRNKIKSIILTAKSIQSMARKYPCGPLQNWRNQPALHIENPSGMWDLLIINQ